MSEFHEEQTSKTTLRVRALKRIVLWRFYSKSLPLFLVTEFPKSGGTWYAKMLSACIDVPFPKPAAAPKLQRMILRDTKLYSPQYHNVSVMMRDGRDIMVSAYHHFLFPNEANVKFRIEGRRRELGFADFDDIETNMPHFIRYMFERFPRQGWGTRFSWSEFVDSWSGRGTPTIRYEDLLTDPVSHMRRMSLALTGKAPDDAKLKEICDSYSFKALTGRSPGEEAKNVFARKGISGDWKNVFNAEARELFRQYGGKQLIALGYEKDDSWAGQIESGKARQ